MWKDRQKDRLRHKTHTETDIKRERHRQTDTDTELGNARVTVVGRISLHHQKQLEEVDYINKEGQRRCPNR